MFALPFDISPFKKSRNYESCWNGDSPHVTSMRKVFQSLRLEIPFITRRRNFQSRFPLYTFVTPCVRFTISQYSLADGSSQEKLGSRQVLACAFRRKTPSIRRLHTEPRKPSVCFMSDGFNMQRRESIRKRVQRTAQLLFPELCLHAIILVRATHRRRLMILL
jgi:hypothetical protein